MPTNTYTPIGSVTLATATSEVTFTVPTGYRDLVLVCSVRSSNQSGAFAQPRLRVNNVSTSSYAQVFMRGPVASSSTTSTDIEMGLMAGTDAGSGQFTPFIAQFFDVNVNDKHKSVLVRNNFSNEVTAVAARYTSTDTITSIQIRDAVGSFAINSQFNLYGIVA